MPVPEATRDTKPSGERSYTVPNGVGHATYPSVTTVLSMIAKPALVPWAARVEREFCVEQLVTLYNERAGAGTESFIEEYQERLGSEWAHKKLSQDATEIGSRVHERIEWELRTELGISGLTEPRIPEALVRRDGSVVQHPAMHAYEGYRRWRDAFKVRPVAVEKVVWSHKWGIAGTLDLLCYVGDRLTVADHKTSKAIYLEMLYQIAGYRQCLIDMGQAEPPLHGMILRYPKIAGDGFEP